MRISDLELYLVEISCDGQDGVARSLLARLGTDQGLEGWGEAEVRWRASELGPRRDVLLPMLAGRSVFDVEELLDLEGLREAPAPIRCALEVASWDLVGRVCGQPLCHLLGGAYRKRVPLAVRLSASSPDQIVQLAREFDEQGFHTQIVPACGRADEDLATLGALAETVSDRVELRFDGAAGYKIDTARELCRDLEELRLQCFLDPLATDNLDEVASLRRETGVRLAVWRMIGGPADVLALVRCGAAPAVVVDLERVGGLIQAKKCAAVAEAAGLGASLGGGPSVGIRAAAMLQLAASTPALAGCNEWAYHQLQHDLLIDPPEISDGMVAVPQGPGLGVEVDRGKLERFQVA